MIKKIIIAIICLVLPLFSLLEVHAYTVPKVLDKFIVDDNININKELESDLYFAGNLVTINTDVYGDIIGAGNTISITGEVTSNIRLAGNILNFNDLSTNNMTIIGSNIAFTNVDADRIYAGGEFINFNGNANNINFAGKKVTINGIINDVSNIYAEEVIIDEDAVIDGKLYVNAEKEIKYVGDVEKKNIIYKHIENYDASKNLHTFSPINRSYSLVYGFITVLILSFILMRLGKNLVNRSIENLRKQPVSTILIGLLVMLAIPFLILFGMITIIGIPLSVMTLFGYIVIFMIARAFSALAISDLLFDKLEMNKYLKVTFAVLITSVITLIPIVNFIAYLAYFGYTFSSTKLLFNKERGD